MSNTPTQDIKVKEFFSTEQTYENGNFKIAFDKFDSRFEFLSAMHYGWKCPSSYKDSSPEKGCCDIRDYGWDHHTDIVKGGIILAFTADDHTERTYLTLQMLHPSVLIVRNDLYNKNNIGMVLFNSSFELDEKTKNDWITLGSALTK